MRADKLIGFPVLLIIIWCQGSYAQQSKSQLQNEKKAQLEKIQEVERILAETATSKKNTLGELNALNRRIEEQEKLIHVITAEINVLGTEISDNKDIIQALERDLNTLKEEYATMLFVAQKANNSITKMAFLFSAESFNQFLMRLQYMHQYGEARKQQIEEITKVQQTLTDKVVELNAKLAEQQQLLGEEVKESRNLTALRTKQRGLVETLVKREKSLRDDLETTKKAVARLEKLIEDIVRLEAERARTARSSAGASVGASFEENKAKFSWPVNGFISQHFGRQKHPVLKGVVLQNDGINIQTTENEKVHSIFAGEVRAVAFIPTLGSSVIIKHGDYLTVYAGLKNVSVKMGQQVQTGQEIGSVQSNSEGVSELRFQIRKSTTPLDPQAWLRSK